MKFKELLEKVTAKGVCTNAFQQDVILPRVRDARKRALKSLILEWAGVYSRSMVEQRLSDLRQEYAAAKLPDQNAAENDVAAMFKVICDTLGEPLMRQVDSIDPKELLHRANQLCTPVPEREDIPDETEQELSDIIQKARKKALVSLVIKWAGIVDEEASDKSRLTDLNAEYERGGLVQPGAVGNLAVQNDLAAMRTLIDETFKRPEPPQKPAGERASIVVRATSRGPGIGSAESQSHLPFH